MILQEQKNLEVERSGKVESSTTMTIDAGSIHILMGFLSKNIYSDAIGSTIREWVSNAWDATVKSGKDVPIMVCLERNNIGGWTFSVEDKALGFDQDDVTNIVSKYLYSTKRQDNTQLGAIGIGLKSGLAYSSSFTFVGRKDGVERAWMMYEDETENKIDLLYEKETSEENGVKFSLTVKNWDVSSFSQKISNQLSYFSNVYIKNDYSTYDNDFTIFENDLFKWSENQSDGKMHVCLGEVYYPLDFAKLGISDIYVPVAIKIGLDEGILPTISRESFMMTPDTKTLILEKIKLIANFFVEKYNETIKSFTNVKDAYPFINQDTHKVTLAEKVFNINSLEKFSSYIIDTVKIEGIEVLPISFIKSKQHFYLYDYEPCAKRKQGGGVTTKHLNEKVTLDTFERHDKVAIISDINVTGHFKKYLFEEEEVEYVVRRKGTFDLHFFKKNFLAGIPKNKWRKAIEEFYLIRSWLEAYLTDYTKAQFSEEFLNYKQRYKRTYIGSYIKKTLNKQKGQVTIGMCRKLDGRVNFTIDKKAYDINTLHQLPFQVIIFDESEKELCRKLGKELVSFPNIRTAIVGKRELNKITLNDKFMLFAKLKEKPQKLKLLKQISTAYLFNKEVDKFEEIQEHRHALISEFLSPLKSSLNTLQNYVNKFYDDSYEDIMEELIVKAVESKEVDYTYWTEYLMIKEANEKLNFLRFFVQTPDEDDEEGMKEYIKMINEQLLLRKLTAKYDLDMFEICSVHKQPLNELEEIKEEVMENQF